MITHQKRTPFSAGRGATMIACMGPRFLAALLLTLASCSPAEPGQAEDADAGAGGTGGPSASRTPGSVPDAGGPPAFLKPDGPVPMGGECSRVTPWLSTVTYQNLQGQIWNRDALFRCYADPPGPGAGSTTCASPIYEPGKPGGPWEAAWILLARCTIPVWTARTYAKGDFVMNQGRHLYQCTGDPPLHSQCRDPSLQPGSSNAGWIQAWDDWGVRP